MNRKRDEFRFTAWSNGKYEIQRVKPGDTLDEGWICSIPVSDIFQEYLNTTAVKEQERIQTNMSFPKEAKEIIKDYLSTRTDGISFSAFVVRACLDTIKKELLSEKECE